MKIMVDGVVRNMTPAEEKEHKKEIPMPAAEEDFLEALDELGVRV